MITKASESLYNQVSVLKSRLSKFDKLIGGGVPFRRITEISGAFSVGKSTLALTLVADAQAQDIECLWADSEFSYTDPYAKLLGIDPTKLDLAQSNTAEELLDLIEEWVRNHNHAVVVLDSIGELLPKEESEKNAESKTIGAQSRIVASFVRKIKPLLVTQDIALIVLNHDVTDIMTGKLKTSGGKKLEHGKGIWIRLKKSFTKQVTEKSNGIRIGDVIEFEIKKNKVSTPTTIGQKMDMVLLYNKGFSTETDLMEEAIEKGIITKQGNSYFFGEQKLGVGLGKIRIALEDPAFAETIKKKLST